MQCGISLNKGSISVMTAKKSMKKKVKARSYLDLIVQCVNAARKLNMLFRMMKMKVTVMTGSRSPTEVTVIFATLVNILFIPTDGTKIYEQDQTACSDRELQRS